MTKILESYFAPFACSIVLFCGCTKVAPPTPTPVADSAKMELERAFTAVQKAPTFENYTQLGLTQLKQGDAASALRSFEQTAKMDPQSGIAFNNVCAAANTLKHWNRAIEACQKAVALAPQMQLAKNNLVVANEGQKRTAERISALETKAQGSNDPDVLLQLGMEYYTQGEYQRAISVWKRAPHEGKNAPVIQNNIASAAILVKDFSLAKQAIEQALAAEPTNQLFLNNRNWLLQAQKDAGSSRQ